MSTISNFIANFDGQGARPNMFEVHIDVPKFGVTTKAGFLCKAASLPSSTIEEIPVPYRGRQVKLPGDRTFEPYTLTFLNDKDFALRTAFEKWMSSCAAHQENRSRAFGSDTSTRGGEQVFADLIIKQLGAHGRAIREYKFVDAFPKNVQAIELNYETNNQVEEFTVEFAYQYWEHRGGGASKNVYV